MLGTVNAPGALAAAQVVKQNLKKIGLDVEVRGLPPQAFFPQALGPRAPFDIAFGVWVGDYVDPYQYLNLLFDGRSIGTYNVAHFNSPTYNARMRRAARLQGDARYREYGRLSLQLARDAAPMVAVDFDNAPTLVSNRVGCILIRPGFALDLTAACLK